MPANISSSNDEVARWKAVMTDSDRQGTMLKPGSAGRRGGGASSESDIGSNYSAGKIKSPSKTPDGRAGS
jgi:hypothetical protein